MSLPVFRQHPSSYMQGWKSKMAKTTKTTSKPKLAAKKATAQKATAKAKKK